LALSGLDPIISGFKTDFRKRIKKLENNFRLKFLLEGFRILLFNLI